MIILPINVETPSKVKLMAAGGTRRIPVTSCVLCLYMQCQIVRYTHTLSTLIRGFVFVRISKFHYWLNFLPWQGQHRLVSVVK